MKSERYDAPRPDSASSLSEHESKKILKRYGIPVISETLVWHADEAVRTAENIGFPVVLKGNGHRLMHKTEQGLVHLNLPDGPSVRKAADRIAVAAGEDLEGFLLQPFIAARREFVAGLIRDPLFGPIIMFGLGGILTEALRDHSFRLAPLNETDIDELLTEIKSATLLQSFRGEAPVDRNQLRETLLGLSCLAMEHPEIQEIDINPLSAKADGSLIALDALIIRNDAPAAKRSRVRFNPNRIGPFFHPRSIAFVGASSQIGKWGHMLFTLTAGSGYKGEIYLVNPKGGKIAGRKVYPTVLDVPGLIDLAVITVPAEQVINLIPQFRQKKVGNVLLVSSGFGETGRRGKKREQTLVDAARKAGIAIVGPNTMGICNPHIQLYCTGSHVRPAPGSTAVVAQSGNMGTQLLAFAEQQGIGIRAFCGSGNEAMITIEDYLEAFEADQVTRTVMLYIESVKDGRRFFESARRVGRKKPIVLLKGGRSRAGHRAAASHTGAMASDSQIFDAVCRQSGIISVEHPMDLLDLAASFASLPLPRGNRVAIMTLGGGWGVVTADLCSKYHIDIPDIPASIISRFDRILPPYWSRANPVDIVGEQDNTIPMTVIETLLEWDGCDAVINLGILGRRILLDRMVDSILRSDPSYTAEFLASARQSFADFENDYIRHIVKLMETHRKPVFGVGILSDGKEKTVYRVDGSPYKGVFYATPRTSSQGLRPNGRIPALSDAPSGIRLKLIKPIPCTHLLIVIWFSI